MIIKKNVLTRVAVLPITILIKYLLFLWLPQIKSDKISKTFLVLTEFYSFCFNQGCYKKNEIEIIMEGSYVWLTSLKQFYISNYDELELKLCHRVKILSEEFVLFSQRKDFKNYWNFPLTISGMGCPTSAKVLGSQVSQGVYQ